jgi:DNA repair protein RecO (recombination protein O)
MQWSDEGLIIGVRRHGESSVIVDAMVAGRGRSMGLVRGGRSSKLSATIQPGNTVMLTWRARLEDHLGTFTIEPSRSRAAALMSDRLRLYASQLLCDHLRLLPERDPHDRLLNMTLAILDFDGSLLATGAALARFELALLDELGFGLDLSRCAATGVVDGLTHVSPKSGRAVSAEAAAPYIDRLLTLPPFLVTDSVAGADDLRAAFRLTGHFLDLHVWMPRRLDQPAIRDALIELVARDGA